MTTSIEQHISNRGEKRLGLDGKLAAYLAAAGAVGSFLASDAEAVIVSNTTVQPFGINGEVSIDFNGDGQTDYQIDHDRVNLNGTDLDYLQIDKNDASSAADPLPINIFGTFPTGIGAANDAVNAKYVTSGPGLGLYPSALTQGTPIGPASFFDFQEGDNFNATGKYIRVNRLIDEDAGQIDTNAGFMTFSPLPGSPNFVGLGGEVRYLGVQMDFNNAGPFYYNWIGVEITNEADATGNVVGWGYETESGVAIPAGAPEPSSIMMAAMGGVFLAGGLMTRKLLRSWRS